MARVLATLILAPVAALALWLALSAQRPRAELVVAVDQIRTIDPHRVSWSDEIRIAQALFEGLTRLDARQDAPQPAVAARWERSDDGLRYRFELRPEARWSTGEPVIAEDFRRSWLRALDPDTESQYAALLFVIDGAQRYYESRLNDDDHDDATPESVGVAEAGDSALEVRLRAPCAYFLELTAFPTLAPVHRSVWAAARGAAPSWNRADEIIGNGPLTLASWQFKNHLWLERNGHYRERNVGPLSLEFLISSSPAASLISYETGRIDVLTDLEPETVAALRRARRCDLHVGDRFATFFFRVNCRRPPLDDPRVRQALSLAIERELLCEHVTALGETPAYTFVPTTALDALTQPRADGGAARYRPPPGLMHRASTSERVSRARELLAASDYAALPRALEIAFAPEPVQQRRIAEAIQAMWERNLGIPVQLRVTERHFLSTRIRELDYDVARSDWYGDYLDPSTFLDLFHVSSAQNRTGWSNAEYDRLIAAAAHEPDGQRRYDLLSQAERILCEQELPILPLYHKRGTFLIRDDVQGLGDNLRGALPVHRARRSGGAKSP